jgi:glucose/arabinose dehydrogenase
MSLQGVRCRWLSVAFLTFLSVLSESAAAGFKSEVVVSNLSRPLFACAPPGDINRLFVLEQHTGRIRIVDLSTRTIKGTFMTVTNQSTSGNEQGLLGLAFHPKYPENGYFYVNVTRRSDGATEITRYQATGAPVTSESAATSTAKSILSFSQPESNHNGGWMGFGPDGFLYISSGDGGGGDDRHGTTGNGQSRTTLLGKILRIDIDNGELYAIPDGNPYKDHATFRREIWAFGLRNPWRCSFDRLTGDLWIGDVGQSTREEIDIAPAGLGGLNFGWRPREGAIQNPAFPNETPVTPAVGPVFDYDNSSVGISVTGGYVYRGEAIPELQGKYICADYGSTRFWMITPNGTNGTATEITAQVNPGTATTKPIKSVSSFGEDGNGEVYVCELAAGRLHKIVPATAGAPSIGTTFDRGSSEFVLNFSAAAGQSYTLQARESLESGSSWTLVTNIPSGTANRTVALTNSVTGQQRYFRLTVP